MSSSITYNGEGIWVSSGIKDAFFEVIVDMAKISDPNIAKEIATGRLTGIYLISGWGFDLSDFIPYFGSVEEFERVTKSYIQVIDSDENSLTEIGRVEMLKLFEWSWFLLAGKSIEATYGRLPNLNALPPKP